MKRKLGFNYPVSVYIPGDVNMDVHASRDMDGAIWMIWKMTNEPRYHLCSECRKLRLHGPMSRYLGPEGLSFLYNNVCKVLIPEHAR